MGELGTHIRVIREIRGFFCLVATVSCPYFHYNMGHDRCDGASGYWAPAVRSLPKWRAPPKSGSMREGFARKTQRGKVMALACPKYQPRSKTAPTASVSDGPLSKTISMRSVASLSDSLWSALGPSKPT